MKKYWALIAVSWQNGLVYRASVFLWRFRQFLSTFFALTIWSTIYQHAQSPFGYSESQMLSYIFFTSVIQSLVVTTALNGLTNRIYSGELSILLVKPINLFKALAAEEVADKGKNVFFALIEAVILFLIFKPELLSLTILSTLVALIWVAGGVVLNFGITLLFGAIGFWSPESWGPRFLFFTFVNFLGGKYFPIDILPNIIQKIVWLTPFPFLSYAQTQALLGRLTPENMALGSLGLCLWIAILTLLVKKTWAKGLINYSASGQ